MDLLKQSISPLWGVIERISATGLHIGFMLLQAFRPILVFLTMPIHSGVNYGLALFLQRQVSIVVIQFLLLLVGLSAFILGLIALI
jgi:hypothetical protein